MKKRSAASPTPADHSLASARTDQRARIRFLDGWREVVDGRLQRGSPVVIEYDPARLPVCRQSWSGALVWNIEALVRVHPRGDIVTGSVLKPRREPPGSGMVVAMEPVPFELEIPGDATKLELWFHNFAVTSTRCDAWDSRFGQNYWFEVEGSPARAPREP